MRLIQPLQLLGRGLPEVPRASHQYAISIVFMRIASYRRMQLSREVLETSLARKQAVLAPLWQIYLRRRRGRRNTAGPPCERMSTRRLALLRKRGLTLFSPERLHSPERLRRHDGVDDQHRRRCDRESDGGEISPGIA